MQIKLVGEMPHNLDEFSGNCDSCLGVLTWLKIADMRSNKLCLGNLLGAFLLGFLIVFIPGQHREGSLFEAFHNHNSQHCLDSLISSLISLSTSIKYIQNLSVDYLSYKLPIN